MSLRWYFKLVFKLSGVYQPLTFSSLLSVLSLATGVATLLVAMALVDSYERAFKESIYSVFSHVVVYRNSEKKQIDQIKKDISSVYKDKFKITEASKKEALLAHKGKVMGVLLDGVNLETVNEVVDLKNKVIEGEFKIDDKSVQQEPHVLLGKDLAKRFALKVGDSFAIVIPKINYSGKEEFSRKLYMLKVGGLVDLGSHDYNKRFIFMDNFHVNNAAGRDADYFTELKVKLSNSEDAVDLKRQLLKFYSDSYWVQSWKDRSGGLLEAIELERWVIFFIVLILVVVAAFNVSTNLFLNVAKRTKDLSILQTLGFSKNRIFFFLVINGALLAVIGLIFGIVCANGILLVLNLILKLGVFVPPEVYKLTQIELEIGLLKYVLVGASTLLLCVLASLSPALSIFKMSITKGLRYE